MAQIYLLSVVANAFAGLLLLSDLLGQNYPFFAAWRKLREDRTAEIAVGVAAAVIGILALIVPSPRETVAVVGDLLPALAGLVMGAVFLGEAFRARVETSAPKIRKVSQAVVTYRVPIGIAGVAVAALHFLVPGVLFL